MNGLKLLESLENKDTSSPKKEYEMYILKQIDDVLIPMLIKIFNDDLIGIELSKIVKYLREDKEEDIKTEETISKLYSLFDDFISNNDWFLSNEVKQETKADLLKYIFTHDFDLETILTNDYI